MHSGARGKEVPEHLDYPHWGLTLPESKGQPHRSVVARTSQDVLFVWCRPCRSHKSHFPVMLTRFWVSLMVSNISYPPHALALPQSCTSGEWLSLSSSWHQCSCQGWLPWQFLAPNSSFLPFISHAKHPLDENFPAFHLAQRQLKRTTSK